MKMDLAGLSQSEYIKRWIPPTALIVILYLIYSPSFLTDYLMNDEWGNIGSSEPILKAATQAYYAFGRALFGAYRAIVYDFVGNSTARIQYIRFLSFASLALAAAVLLLFLESGQMRNRWLAFLTVLFFFSQLPVQGVMGYSLQLVSNTLPSIWLSLLAFYLYFYAFPRGHLPKVVQVAITFVILALAMQSTQTYAFFCTIPLAYLALSDWTNRKRQIVDFLLIAFAVLVVSIVAFKLSTDALHNAGSQAYALGEQGMNDLFQKPGDVILTAINPLAYASAFKLWTFPYPLTNLKPLTPSVRQTLTILVMILWTGLIGMSIWSELRSAAREERRAILLKWLVVLVCFGLAAVFVVADSPTEIIDHRPHIYLVFSGLICFTAGYALDVLIQSHAIMQKRVVAFLIVAMVLLTALGAQAGFLRNMVNNHARPIEFVRSMLLSKDPSSYKQVIVVLPNRAYAGMCVTEPCGPWLGDVLPGRGWLQFPGFYRYALATAGASTPAKTLQFVQSAPPVPPPTSLVVDWNVFLRNFLYSRRR